MSSRNIPAGLISKGFQRIVMNSTATGLNSTCSAGTTILFSIEGANVRATFDGTTTPTANTGVLFAMTGSPSFAEPTILTAIDLTKIKFARASAGTILNIHSFGFPADKTAPSNGN